MDHLAESHKEHSLMVKYVKENDPIKLRDVIETHILRTKDNLIKMIEMSGRQ